MSALALLALGSATPARADGDGLKVSGDFRLRYENNENVVPGSTLFDSRNRAVVRFRAGVTHDVNEYLGFGVRVTTGNPDDPNTADVTLGSFLDDLVVSLDRAYLNTRYEGLSASGGKFANPFRRTDLVWDGDVNPQGVTASYRLHRSDKVTPKVTGLFFVIDEHETAAIQDSRMGGGQLELDLRPHDDLGVTLAGAYYDYDINSLAAADGGDIRSNHVIRDMSGDPIAYLSDFDLVDLIGVVQHRGFGERAPVRLVGNYVKNVGAEATGPGQDKEDQGFGVDVFVGRASRKRDARVRYGYARCETDAVLAAFSHDNTTIATNYEQHTVTVDYVVVDDATLNVTWYLHRLLETDDPDADGWVSRVRVNAVIRF